jgi:hypothetical protein
MRNRRSALFVLLGMALLLAGKSDYAQDAASAQSFLKSVFALYSNHGKGVQYNHRYLHSSLLALIAADSKAAGQDNVPYAGDADIVCGCQDWERFVVKKMDIRVDKPGHALATVSFSLFEEKDKRAEDLRTYRYILASEDGQWRIFDIEYLTDPGKPNEPWSVRKQIALDTASFKRESK